MEGQFAKISKRSYRLDLLKAISIIGVFFYHSGVLKYGYLGVEVFFVIAGYFLMKGYLKAADSNKFAYFPFVLKRIQRFWPSVLVISFLCLAIGFFTMLPDDFENLGESVVASSLFSNNILEAITTKNYWNLGNNYKPLMHLWYIGILVQAYILLPILFRAADKVSRKVLHYLVVVLIVVSLAMYLSKVFSSGDKFYYIPFRLFEILAGSELCFLEIKGKNIRENSAQILFWLLFIMMTIVMFIGLPFSGTVNLLVETAIATALVYVTTHSEEPDNSVLEKVSIVGTASFSVYVIHQPILAFTRYFYTGELSGIPLTVDIVITAVLSVAFYYVFEKKFDSLVKRAGWEKSFIALCCFCVVVSGCGLAIYLRAGVVRDFPELDVSANDVHRGMHAEYVDVPYGWNRDFETGKIHILVVGDSMGRDWCNILNEYDAEERFEISYVFVSDISNEMYYNRLQCADYIFYATIGDSSENLPNTLYEYSQNANFYIVGIKNFGESNGQIYQRRYQNDYYSSTIRLGKSSLPNGISYEEQNDKQKAYWGDKYIDMIEPIRNTDGSVPVFTDTKKFISADTEHLTRNGCIYYAKILDLSFIQ